MELKYNYAHAILHDGQPNKLVGVRDQVFIDILKSFEGAPIKVFQVGAIETFEDAWRSGSGWSDIIFGQYIAENGGSISVCDIRMDSLAHSAYAASKLGYPLEVCYGDAFEFIAEGYDIYYLDGSNDPQETLQQYLKVRKEKAVFLVDDFDIKGTLLGFLDVKYLDIANGFGIIDQR